MASFKALCLAGVAIASASAAAHAADLPSPALPPAPVYAPPPAPVASGVYRAAAHYSANESYTAAAGTDTASPAYDKYDASIRSVIGLVNGYVDAGTWYGITPFAGAGVGVGYVSVKNLTDLSYGNAYGYGNGGGGFAYDHAQTKFAYALMAGLDMRVTPNLTLELGYRYLDLGNVSSGQINCVSTQFCGHEVQHYRLAYSDIRLGARYMFNDFVPRAPVIARY